MNKLEGFDARLAEIDLECQDRQRDEMKTLELAWALRNRLRRASAAAEVERDLDDNPFEYTPQEHTDIRRLVDKLERDANKAFTAYRVHLEKLSQAAHTRYLDAERQYNRVMADRSTLSSGELFRAFSTLERARLDYAKASRALHEFIGMGEIALDGRWAID